MARKASSDSARSSGDPAAGDVQQDQSGGADAAVVAHLRARHHLVCRRIPLSRRRLVWARALYSCDVGPTYEDGPFEGEQQGGCGWHRYVYLGVGVGKPAMPNVPAIPPPPEAGVCERCGGPLSHDLSQAVLWLPEGWPEGEVDTADRDPVPKLLIPGKRVAGKMAHEGALYAQLHEADDPLTDPGER